MEKYKFSQLKEKAKIQATEDYLNGYYEATKDWRDDYNMTFVEAYEGFIDCEEELFYDRNGKLIEESEEE